MCRQCNFPFLAVMAAFVCLTGTMPYGDYIYDDANCDGAVNVSDAVYINNYIFAGGNPPGDPDGDGVPDC